MIEGDVRIEKGVEVEFKFELGWFWGEGAKSLRHVERPSLIAFAGWVIYVMDFSFLQIQLMV